MSAPKGSTNSSIKIEPLSKQHDRSAFSCGYADLDTYIKVRASQEAKKQIATPFVLVGEGKATVIGYYSLAATSILLDDLPETTVKKLPKYPDIPATRLGRLAVDSLHKGKRYGELLLMDALRRAFQATADVASYSVVVDAKGNHSRAFYLQCGFLPFPENRLRLFLPMQTIVRLFT